MRVFFFGNNELAVRVLDFLISAGTPIVGLSIHPPGRAKFAERLQEIAGVPDSCVFNGETLRHTETVQAIRELKADLGLSVKFGYILKPELFGIFPQGCLNLHTSFLPFNRGANPNVWPIVEGTPAGVTLHRIDASIDTGPVVAREEVAVVPTETGQTLYQKLEEAAYRLFVREWPAIQSGRLTFSEQPVGGTSHTVKDYERLRAIDAEKLYRAADLINIMRACTFPPYPGAYLNYGDRKVFMRLELYEG